MTSGKSERAVLALESADMLALRKWAIQTALETGERNALGIIGAARVLEQWVLGIPLPDADALAARLSSVPATAVTAVA